ncbi:MAG: superoxide dismutase [Candidatus Omnitrophica bacterium]|nr:superoxide dismutase [Candidatus Omnitrophota bacterium]
MKKVSLIAVMLTVCSLFASSAHPHCQIPCGIYDDEMRLELIAEDIHTVEKAMNQIKELSQKKDKDLNQIIRWVNNKDKHADRISETVSYYFMAQRLAPASPGEEAHKEYVYKLSLLHELMYNAMKAKQTLDHTYVENMRRILDKFRAAYM